MLVPKLRFKEFTDEWKKYYIDDIANIYLGLTYTPTYVNEGVPFISSKDISKGYLDMKNSKYISIEEFHKASSNAKPIKGDILFTRVGSNLGNPTIVDINYPFAIFVSLGFLRPKSSNINNVFLQQWMRSNYFWHQVDSKVAGGAKQNLNTGWLKKFDVNIPTISEQNKLSDLMLLLDRKIQLQEQKIEVLKLYKKGTLNTLTNNIDNNNLKTLKEIGINYSGLSGKSKEDFDTGTSYFITYMSVFKNAIDKKSFRKVNINSNENQNNVKNKDLFFTVSSETKEEVGMCATINTDNEDLYLNSFCFGYRLNNPNSVNNNYLCYLLLSEKYRKIISDLGQGFTRVNLSKKELLNVLVPIPSIEYQILYSNTLKTMDTRIKLEVDKLEKFNELKKGLMQNMFV